MEPLRPQASLGQRPRIQVRRVHPGHHRTQALRGRECTPQVARGGDARGDGGARTHKPGASRPGGALDGRGLPEPATSQGPGRKQSGARQGKLATADETARNALDQTRNLAIELRRSVSSETENGVATALRTLIETSVPDGVEAGLSFSGDESTLPRDIGAQVYLVMREAIRNALKHSGCEELQASLEVHPAELVGTVSDDGDGFDPGTISDDGRGIGLRSMRERAEMMGGELELTSHPGDGTTVEIRVPLAAD